MTRILFVLIALTALAACDYGAGYDASYDTTSGASAGGDDRSGGY